MSLYDSQDRKSWYKIPSEAQMLAWYNQTNKNLPYEDYKRRTIRMRRRKAAFHERHPDIAYGTPGYMMANHWNRNLMPYEKMSDRPRKKIS